MLTLPEYRAKYTYYVDQLIQTYYNNDLLDPALDNVRDMIIPFRIPDTYAQEDYDWNLSDFNNSFDNFDDAHVKYGLKSFITKRKNKALDQLDDYDILPIMNHTTIESTENEVKFTADVIDDIGVTSVVLHYSIDGTEWTESSMHLNSDNLYSTTVSINTPGMMQYYIKATDSSNQSRNFPNCGHTVINTGYLATPKLVINEFMASNNNTITDNHGEYEDWIELYNADDTDILLSNYYLSDNSEDLNKWQLPNISLGPDEYLLIWADEDSEQGDTHANFKLSKGGEKIGIYDNENNNYAPLDFIEYGAQNTDVSFGRIPNGVGNFEVLDYSTPNANNDINTAIKEITFQDLSIHPNPASFEIKIDEIYKGGEYTISDIQGNVLISAIYEDVINIKDLPSGIYFIAVLSQRNTSVDKFIVVR